MCRSTHLCVLVLTGSVLLCIFKSLEATIILDEDQVQEVKKNLTWLKAQEQITSGKRSILRNIKQNNSNLFHNVSYQHLVGTLSQKKKLLTTGLSSNQGIYIISIMQSVFSASTKAQLGNSTVLGHLSDPDFDSLRQMSINISGICAPQILPGQLLVICTLIAVYLSLEEPENQP